MARWIEVLKERRGPAKGLPAVKVSKETSGGWKKKGKGLHRFGIRSGQTFRDEECRCHVRVLPRGETCRMPKSGR